MRTSTNATRPDRVEKDKRAVADTAACFLGLQVVMDTRLEELRRRFEGDPTNPMALTDLARALDQAGEDLEAFLLLAEHGALEREDPFALVLGHRLAAEEPIGELDLSGQAFAATLNLEEGREDWRWHSRPRFRELGLPLRALSIDSKDLSGDLRRPLSKLRALRSLALDAEDHPEFSLAELDLSALGALRELSVYHFEGPEDGLACLSELTRLRELTFYWCPELTHRGLLFLAPLTKLTELDIYDCRGLNSEALDCLAPFTELHRLELDSIGDLSEANTEALIALTRLDDLKITGQGGLDNDQLLHLARLPELKNLWVSVSQVDDRGLARFAESTHLEFLRLRQADSIQDLAALAAWPGLKELSISEASSLPSSAFQSLSSAPVLEKIDLTSSPLVEDAIFPILASLPHLKEVSFALCPTIRGQGVEALAGLPGLKSLRFFSCRVSDHLDGLGALSGLRSLCLDHCDGIDDQEFAMLTSLKRLEELKLSFARAGDVALSHIAELSELKHLDLGYCNVTDEGLEELARLENLEELVLQSCEITDRGLAILANFPALVFLDLGGCERLSYEGFAGLSPLSGSLRQLSLYGTRLDRLEIMRRLPFLDGVE